MSFPSFLSYYEDFKQVLIIQTLLDVILLGVTVRKTFVNLMLHIMTNLQVKNYLMSM
ncbi:hypothetical protein OZD61_02850 [Wolbachia endosymbiont of Drosophila bocki]|uniref:hypothetical protein n=1 Tax=Wolbachia endosymbiont of Drosophila bocki TaxID=3002576 RepID=UPI0023A95792|nr:hypothetical protein [Wolbachia endosymbiont of Drosophila bocki]MDE5057720.1 hypothetical protein [Wolbachia endosymbiont of Drosophila bocki]